LRLSASRDFAVCEDREQVLLKLAKKNIKRYDPPYRAIIIATIPFIATESGTYLFVVVACHGNREDAAENQSPEQGFSKGSATLAAMTIKQMCPFTTNGLGIFISIDRDT